MKILFEKKSITNLLFPCFWIITMFLIYSGKQGIYYGVLLLLSLFLIVVLLIKDGRRIISKNYYMLFLFVMYYFIITLINGSLYSTFLVTTKYFSYAIIVIYLLRSTSNIKSSLMILKTFILFSSIYGIIEYLSSYNFMVNYVKISASEWIQVMNNLPSELYKPSSFFLHYNYFSYIAVVSFCISLNIKYSSKIMELLNKVILILVIIICQSRIVWISFSTLLVFNYILFDRNKNSIIKKIFATTIIGSSIYFIATNLLGITFDVVSDRIRILTDRGLDDGSVGQRWGTLVRFKDYFLNNGFLGIFGNGYTGQMKYLKVYSYYDYYETADSMITIFLVETGIIGLILIVLAIINVFRLLNRRKTLDRMVILVLIATVIESFTIDFVANDVILTLFYFMLFIPNIEINKKCVGGEI